MSYLALGSRLGISHCKWLDSELWCRILILTNTNPSPAPNSQSETYTSSPGTRTLNVIKSSMQFLLITGPTLLVMLRHWLMLSQSPMRISNSQLWPIRDPLLWIKSAVCNWLINYPNIIPKLKSYSVIQDLRAPCFRLWCSKFSGPGPKP